MRRREDSRLAHHYRTTVGLMKRSGPIERRTPLRRTPFRVTARPEQLRRRPLSPVSSKRKRVGVDPALRERVIMRDGGCIAVRLLPHSCWGRIDPHHVWRYGGGGPDEAWNLIAVCRAAHDWIHAHPAEAIRLGLLSSTSLGEYGARQAEVRRLRRL